MKKILIITPTPTHPPDAGNRAAILALANELMDAGFELHCLYFPAENYLEAQMVNFFKGNFYTIDREFLNYKIPSARYYLKRVFQKLDNLRFFFLEKFLGAGAEPYKYNRKIDENLSFFMKKFTRKIASQYKFDVVIAEYVWLSGLLKCFPKKTLKVIDTHDRFSNRYLVYKKLNQIPEWNSLFPSEEAKGLKRADLLLALSLEEKAYFEKISGVKTLVRLPATLGTPVQKKMFDNRLLYFASDNVINISSIKAFLKDVFPLVQIEIPSMQLFIGGKICHNLHEIPANVILKGTFDNPSDFYNSGDIIINPEIDGTGFKIKTFEALSHGMPVVCTSAGAEGVQDAVNKHLVVVNDSSEFATAIITLSRNEVLRNQISSNAYEWARKAAENSSRQLLDHLNENLAN